MQKAEVLHTISSWGKGKRKGNETLVRKEEHDFSVVSLQYISGVTFSEAMWTCTWETRGWGLFSVSLTCMCDVCRREPECRPHSPFQTLQINTHSSQHHLGNGQNHYFTFTHTWWCGSWWREGRHGVCLPALEIAWFRTTGNLRVLVSVLLQWPWLSPLLPMLGPQLGMSPGPMHSPLLKPLHTLRSHFRKSISPRCLLPSWGYLFLKSTITYFTWGIHGCQRTAYRR